MVSARGRQEIKVGGEQKRGMKELSLPLIHSEKFARQVQAKVRTTEIV